ncbi:MAG: hypothetical protein NTW02_03765 [Cyanobium sp. LacPavin_0920_WC12_MAG_62_9]|nr:hypothetical protein [Cyanobium sp. LacPavin_0920_WC12_MAG_62_9]
MKTLFAVVSTLLALKLPELKKEMTQVSSECLEILAFLLNSINNNHDQSVIKPLYKWSDLLRSNGFYPEELGNFLESADALDHWHGTLGLDALYRQSILESDSTGDFLDAIYSAEPDYIKFISNKVDCLLAERNQLLAAAGGTLKHPNVVGATISSSVLFLSCVIAYKTRGSWRPTLSKWADVASGWFTNREVATVNNDLDSAITYEIKTINNPYKDIFKFAIEPVVPNAPISKEQLRRDKLRFREDPTSFLNDMVKSHPEIFNLTPAGFKADLKYGYKVDIVQIQTEFNKQVDKIAKAYYGDWFQSNNPQHSVGKVIQQEEIKVAKQTLLNAAKANSDGDQMSPVFQWFKAKDERQRLLLLLELDKKLLAQVNEGDGKYNGARVVQDLIEQCDGVDGFNAWLRNKAVAIKDSEDKLKELDELINEAGESMNAIGDPTGVALCHLNNVLSRREGSARAGDDHHGNTAICGCGDERLGGCVVEGFIERVERFGTVEGDGPDAIDV